MPNTTKNTVLLNAGDISRPLISINHDKTLYDARTFLLRYNITRIAVSKDGIIVGIITEKDISKFLYEHFNDGRRLSEIPIQDLLLNRNELITVNKDSTLGFCAKSMLNNNISSLFLIDNKGKIDGILTKTDLVEVFAYHYSGYFTVNECMTKKVITAQYDDNIHFLSLLMNMHKISRIVIVKNDHPIGIVTLKDLLPISVFHDLLSDNYIQEDTVLVKNAPSSKAIPSVAASFIIALDIMTSRPILIDRNEDVVESAKIMIRHRISGIPVTDQNMKLVGIITKTDMLKTILKI